MFLTPLPIINRDMSEKEKIDIRLQHHFVCNDCTKEEINTVLFYNADDSVCIYCGSKNTDKLFQARLKAEIFLDK